MALLQVRDFPQELYETLTHVAKAENRSTAQQTIVLLRDALGKKEGAIHRRQALLKRIDTFEPKLSDEAPSAADLIREDRER